MRLKQCFIGVITIFCFVSSVSAQGIEGTYIAGDVSTSKLTIKLIKGNQYQITGNDSGNKWYGIGIFDGKVYYGVWYTGSNIGSESSEYLHGTHEAHLHPDGSFRVVMRDTRKLGEKEVRVTYQGWTKSK